MCAYEGPDKWARFGLPPEKEIFFFIVGEKEMPAVCWLAAVLISGMPQRLVERFSNRTHWCAAPRYALISETTQHVRL